MNEAAAQQARGGSPAPGQPEDVLVQLYSEDALRLILGTVIVPFELGRY